jgi:hypothetical protein
MSLWVRINKIRNLCGARPYLHYICGTKGQVHRIRYSAYGLVVIRGSVPTVYQ